MTRVVSVGRSKSLIAAGALGFTLVALSLSGCPGSLDNPNLFPTGSAGTSGTAGTTGTSGTTGMAGTSMAGSTGAAGTGAACDAHPIFAAKMCALNGACHDAVGSAAKLDMTSTGWEKALVGQVPRGMGNVPSMCATGATATEPYIKKGSNPATGLLLDKLSAVPPCGMRMPELTPPLTDDELKCVQSWATQLANQ